MTLEVVTGSRAQEWCTGTLGDPSRESRGPACWPRPEREREGAASRQGRILSLPREVSKNGGLPGGGGRATAAARGGLSFPRRGE